MVRHLGAFRLEERGASSQGPLQQRFSKHEQQSSVRRPECSCEVWSEAPEFYLDLGHCINTVADDTSAETTPLKATDLGVHASNFTEKGSEHIVVTDFNQRCTTSLANGCVPTLVPQEQIFSVNSDPSVLASLVVRQDPRLACGGEVLIIGIIGALLLRMRRHWVYERRGRPDPRGQSWCGDVRRIYEDGSVCTSRNVAFHAAVTSDRSAIKTEGADIDPQSAAIFAAFDAEPSLRKIVLMPSRAN